MVVHIHEMLSEKKDMNAEFSYLSSKYFFLIDDNGKKISENLRNDFTLSFDDLISLHGYERKNKDKEFIFNDALRVFINLINNNELDKYYDNNGGYNRKYFTDEQDSLICKKTDLLNKCKNLKISGPFLEVNNAIPDEYKLFLGNGYLKGTISLPSNAKIEDTIKLFDGDWLERYIFGILISEFKTIPSIQIYNNWVIKKPAWKNNLDFELDVILIRGYQLFGISCTTSSVKSICKSKGFEIILRTEQIGGDESKAVLVTLAEDNTVIDLQEELGIETGSKGNILVLGKNDLKKTYLIQKIKNFMGD